MKKIVIILAVIFSQFINAQDKGIIKGKLTDKEMNNEALSFANVVIKGTLIGTQTDFDGNYSIAIKPGTYTIVFSFLGYKTIEVPVTVKAGETITIDKVMSAEEGVTLEEIKIKATVGKQKETALLMAQKKAVTIDQKIGVQELSRKGVGDVATALTKTTGISKQQGSGGVFVRGLGDRYNVTTLNGLPLPSNNPSNKNIDLDIFSTDIIEFISIDKTYNVKNYGDFAGANVDIVSKNYQGKGFIELSVGSSINTEAISQDTFYLNEGPNKSGFYSRAQPAFPLNNYNFTTSWDRQAADAPINTNFALKAGDTYQLGEDTKLSVFGVASFDNAYKFSEGISRGSVNVSGVARRDYDFKSYRYETNTTAMGNIRLKHKDQVLKYNALMINTSSQRQEEYFGIVDIFDYAPEGGAFVQRATFDRTELFVHQLLGDHRINEALTVNWGASYNYVKNDTPNRKQNILTPDDWNVPDGPKSFQLTNNDSDNHRFYQDVEEEELAVNFSTTYKFNQNEDEEYLGKIQVGYSGRFKTVDFESTQFNFRIINGNNDPAQPNVASIYDLDSYFNQANFNAGLFTIRTFRGGLGTTGVDVLAPQTYDGKQNIHAGFVSAEYAFSPKFTAIVGIRGEQINQTLTFNTSVNNGSSDLDQFEILPMVSLKYELNEKQNLKFAASKSYTLPQYKERALFQFEEVTQAYIGNPSLYSSTDYNFDVKWDFFPKSNEIISVGAFGKYIQNPINSVTINSASNDVSWVNSGDKATAFGIELEVRKSLFERETEDVEENTLKNNLTAGFNASYLSSSQDLDGDKVVAESTASGFPVSVDFTETKSKISGASDLLLNADVSYLKEYSKGRSIQTTLSFNYFSDRVFALGTEGKGNVIDSGVGTLDFIFKAKLNKRLGVGFTAKNLLNPSIERTQETQDVKVSSFKLGSNIKLSLSYNF
jgi:hypothetical protein